MTNNRLMTPSDVAMYLDVAQETVREWLRTGQLKGRQINGRWWIDPLVFTRFSTDEISTLTRDAIPLVQADIDANMIKLKAAYEAIDYEAIEKTAGRISGLVSTLREAESIESFEDRQQINVWKTIG